MRVTRRTFFQTSTIVAGTALLDVNRLVAQRRGGDNSGGTPIPESIRSLKPLPNPAPPITDDERRARIAKAQRLMTEQGLRAIVLESGRELLSAGVRDRHRLPAASSVQSALTALVRQDIVMKDQGRYIVNDSLYREWMARRTF